MYPGDAQMHIYAPRPQLAMIENMPYTTEKEQDDFDLKSAEEKEKILGIYFTVFVNSTLLFHRSKTHIKTPAINCTNSSQDYLDLLDCHW